LRRERLTAADQGEGEDERCSNLRPATATTTLKKYPEGAGSRRQSGNGSSQGLVPVPKIDADSSFRAIKRFAVTRRERNKPIYDFVFKSEALSLNADKLIKYFRRFKEPRKCEYHPDR
jgi:hypothetical protein